MDAMLSPDRLLAAYAGGIFPMADEHGRIHWLAPDPRAVLEPEALRVSRSLRAVLKRGDFRVTADRAFDEVITACADRAEGTWISPQLRRAYRKLHEIGFAHSVESWQDDELAGGLYGVAIGGAFFGESMFHRVANASKVALVWLVGRLSARGFSLLDVQFATDHLRRFGAVEIPRSEYQRRVYDAVRLRRSFGDMPEEP